MATSNPAPTTPSEIPGTSASFLVRWRLQLGTGAVVLVLLTFWAVRASRSSAAPTGAGRSVPVVAATARKGEMNVNLTGLGTVVPLSTVTVHSRVDGQLMRIAFTEGQLVREGDLLAEIDPRPFQVQLMQAEGQLAKDQAAAKNASMDLVRFQDLARQGILAQQQLDAQVSLVNQSEATLKADQAQVESAKLNLVYSRITAPLSGRVGLRLVDLGNMVHATDAGGLVVIAPVQPINVVFTIPADSIQQVMARSRQGTRLPVEAYDRELKHMLAEGELEAIDNQVDTSTGTVKLKARFANENLALFPNQFVNAQLPVDTLKDVIIIPTAAIQQSPQGPYVYLVKTDGTVELRIVGIRATEGDDTALQSGVKNGETVVTDGMEKLRPGSKVTIAKPEVPGTTKAKP